MTQELVEALQAGRDDAVQTWAARIKQSSDHYRTIPLEEVAANVGRFMDAVTEGLGTGNYEALESVLVGVCSDRTSRGFDAHDIQRGLLMGCESILPILDRAFRGDAQKLVWSVAQIERVMQRATKITQRWFETAQASRAQSALDVARDECAEARRRLQAVLDAFGHAALVAGPDLVIKWVDERAASPQFGLHAPGDAHECVVQDPDDCAVESALRTGQVQRRTPSPDCKAHTAIPVKSPEGEVLEVVVLF